jgi:hypothetical protein
MSTTEAEEEKGPAEPAYPNSATWVARWLCPNLEREIKRTFEWCPQWWDHPRSRPTHRGAVASVGDPPSQRWHRDE